MMYALSIAFAVLVWICADQVRTRRAAEQRERGLQGDLAFLRERARGDLQRAVEMHALETAELRKEIRRLTNIIIRMRIREKHELPPEATDERWGRYAMADVEMQMSAERERRLDENPDYEADEALVAEITAELDI